MRRLAAVFAVGLLVAASGCITVAAPAPAPAAGGDAVVAAQAPAPAPAGGGLFGLRKSPEAKAQKWANFAKTPVGQMVNNLLKPAGALTGGVVGPVGANDPAKQKLPADTPAGAAAKIAAAEAAPKAKITNIEFLAKKDCRRYPEAEAAILVALRADPNECVRWAAAKALLSGCCCTPKVVKALTVVVNQSDKDGNLAEESERVRLTAFLALEKCLRVCQPKDEPPEKPGPKGEAKGGEVAQAKFEAMTEGQVFAEARAALARGVSVSPDAMRRMNGPANVRDVVFGPPLPPAGVAATPTPPATTQDTPPAAPPDPPAATPRGGRSLAELVRQAWREGEAADPQGPASSR